MSTATTDRARPVAAEPAPRAAHHGEASLAWSPGGARPAGGPVPPDRLVPAAAAREPRTDPDRADRAYAATPVAAPGPAGADRLAPLAGALGAAGLAGAVLQGAVGSGEAFLLALLVGTSTVCLALALAFAFARVRARPGAAAPAGGAADGATGEPAPAGGVFPDGAAADPFAVTWADGTPIAAGEAFRRLAAARGRPEALAPLDLASSDEDRRHLYLLCRRALAAPEVASSAPSEVGLLEGGEGQAPLAVSVAPLAFAAGGTGLLWRLLPGDADEARPAAVAAGPVRAFLDAFASASPGAVAAIDAGGRILAASEAFRRLIRPPAAGETARIDDLLVGEEGRPASAILAPVAAGERARLEIDLPARAEAQRLYRLSAAPLDPGVPGRSPVAILSLADVTQQSALEAQFAQGQKLQAIGQLAGGVAHDFNNVLTAIIGFSDLLLQSHRPSDPSFRDIMNIRQSAQRAAGLVRQLLAFSRRQTLRPASLDLNDLMAELSVMLDRLLGERVALRIEYGRDLWPVMADVSQLEQVVINLSVNARDAMPGGGTLVIRTRNVPADEVAAKDVEGAVAGDAVAIEVADTGTGIPPGILDKIFEPFFTTKEIGEGTGLGLSTVYGIVKQTGGSLLVDTRQGEGTTFTVLLPRSRPEADDPAPADGAEAGRGADGSPGREAALRRQDLTGSATLLLVEDEEAIRMFAARALSNKGYRVLTAANGLDALDVIAEEEGRVDLLVSDVIMPEMDGPALVGEVERLYPDMRIMLMSGYADAAQAGALEARRDIRFIPKPFTLKGLAEAVKAALGD